MILDRQFGGVLETALRTPSESLSRDSGSEGVLGDVSRTVWNGPILGWGPGTRFPGTG
jgi:hypothetical protein